MLIIFNTAYRPGYLRNVLRTLFLPLGARNEFRYKVGDDAQISERQMPLLVVGTEVLICFGDRFAASGYQFHPLRKGKLLDVKRAGTRVYLTVELAGHISAKSVDNFTQFLRQKFPETGGDNQIPALTSGDPNCVHDGKYVHEMSDGLQVQLDENEHAWRATSESLSHCKAFETTREKQFVFARSELLVNGKMRSYDTEKNGALYKLSRNDDLRLRIYYYYPAQETNVAATAKLTLKPSQGMYVLAPLEQPLDMAENRLDIPLGLDKRSERSFETIEISFGSNVEGTTVIGASEALSAKIRDPALLQFFGFLGVLSYVVGAIFSAADKKILGEILKGLGIFVMIFVWGKMIV